MGLLFIKQTDVCHAKNTFPEGLTYIKNLHPQQFAILNCTFNKSTRRVSRAQCFYKTHGALSEQKFKFVSRYYKQIHLLKKKKRPYK